MLSSCIKQKWFIVYFISIFTEMAENEYMCTLDDQSMHKAKCELSEDAKERLSALRTFQKWITDQQKWLKTPTGSVSYPLTFLQQIYHWF